LDYFLSINPLQDVFRQHRNRDKDKHEDENPYCGLGESNRSSKSFDVVKTKEDDPCSSHQWLHTLLVQLPIAEFIKLLTQATGT
jgi:hypothetical protein